ncbi:MAG: hypothetical protein HYY02_06725, partial [Chloroflexi bacterium]|nr:hypothetical protein [Chloroflexota bacterium]
VEQAWEDLRLTLQDVGDRLERLVTGMEALSGGQLEHYDDLLAEAAGLLFTCQELLQQGNAVIARADPAWVCWLAATGQSEGVGLYAAPLEVGTVLQRDLFAKKASVVLTSATLQTSGSFDYLRRRLGLEGPRELAVGSPFPYRSAALVLVPQDIPDPQRPGHARALEQALADLCEASQGRALVLFTSYAGLHAAHRALTQLLEPKGIRVLAQGVSGSAHQLLERLRQDAGTVLLGTSTFWEGVDVVGEALSLLVITRLPFSVPTEPVFAARSEGFEDPFREYAVPQAVLRFRQGFGRLIRSKTDRGVAVVLDPRVANKSYGAAFLDSLPPVTLKRCTLREASRLLASWLQPPTG